MGVSFKESIHVKYPSKSTVFKICNLSKFPQTTND